MKNETRIKKLAKKELKLQKIHEDRLSLSQEIGYLFRPLAICPFPAKQPKKIKIIREKMGIEVEEECYETHWERRNGKIKVEITAHEKYGIPYGQDILIVLYLAREALKQKRRDLKVNFYRDFCRMFEINPRDGRKYRLVQKSLQRIRHAHFTWIDEGEETRERETHYLYIDEIDLYFDPKNPEAKPLWGEQTIVISERFWNEITKHKIPFNLEIVRYLKNKPAHLNFYIWLSYRVWTIWNAKQYGQLPKDEAVLIPFWGKNGLQEQLSSQVKRRFEYRREVKRWLETVKEVWPRCPVQIEGDALIINIIDESQLDVMESPKTEGKRLRKEREKKALLKAKYPIPERKTCPICQSKLVSKKGTKNKKGVQQPDYYHCEECGFNLPREAICPHCWEEYQEVVTLENELNGSYRCPQCKKTYNIKKYWDFLR